MSDVVSIPSRRSDCLAAPRLVSPDPALALRYGDIQQFVNAYDFVYQNFSVFTENW